MKKEQPIPRSITLKPEQLTPDLATAFKRWLDMGEFPAGCRLGELVGTCAGTAHRGMVSPFRDVVTGELFDAAELPTVQHVRVPVGKKTYKELMIFGAPA